MQLFQMKAFPHKKDRLQQWLKEDFVNIGWPLLGNLTNVSKEELKLRLSPDDTTYPNYTYLGQVLANQLGTISAFVHTMKKGDIVMVTENDWVHVAKVEEYEYDPHFDTDAEGMCHKREVKWLAMVHKNSLNETIQELLRNRGAVTRYKHPFSQSELEAIINNAANEENLDGFNASSAPFTSDDIPTLQNKALQILAEALYSNDFERRERAAIAIMKLK